MSDGGPLEGRLRRYSAAVGAELREATATRHGLDRFYGMVHYHMGWVDRAFRPETAGAGKGLRSAFCLLCCEVCGGDWQDAVSIAAAIDLIHNFSLIHDDIEDDSLTRRHRDTVWALWGVAQGINLGDAVFALGQAAFFRSPLAVRQPAELLEIVRAAQDTIILLAEGQYLDMSFETRLEVTVAEYLAMIERKSAVLIGYAAWAGAMAAPASGEQRAALRDFGRELGLAFQIRDDLLGIWGDEAVTGKSGSSDILSRKKSLPIVLALAGPDNPEGARASLRAIYADSGPMEEATVARVLGILDALNVRTQAEEHLTAHRHAAEEALARAGLPAAQSDLLREFSALLVDRVS